MREIEQHLDGRRRAAADFGAGKSPVPVALRRLGLETAVVDPDSQAQTGRHVGGAWAWTDYGQWGIKTYRAGIEDEVFGPGSLGVAVSVSAIEHVPAVARRRGLRRVAGALEPGGLLVLTVDLQRGGRQLWNHVLGLEVDPVAEHGSLDDLISEAEAVGFALEKLEPCPIADRKVDVVGMVFVTSATTPARPSARARAS